MAKRRKRTEPKYRVQVTIRGQAANQVDELLQTGFYGTDRSKAVSKLISESLLVKREETKSRYGLVFEVHGYSAYVLDEMAHLREQTREKTLEQMLFEWTSTNWKMLSAMGLSIQDAKRKGYLPKKR
mgnify:CR=1 FL=1